MVSLVGVVTDVTSAIIGAVVSVVVLSVEVELSLSVVVESVKESLSLLLLQEMIVKLKRDMKWTPSQGQFFL